MKVESVKFNINSRSPNVGFKNVPAFKSAHIVPDSFHSSINPRFSWLKDKTIFAALEELKKVKFDNQNVAKIKSKGLILPFENGEDAVNFIVNSNLRIKFDSLSSPTVHAQYDFDDNFIKINKLYKGVQDPNEISAIAGAILHEAGHAKDKDGQSSIQEELECLSLNALAYKAFSAKNVNVSSSDAPIIKEGVELYANLFFDELSDEKLIKRVKDKYGFLPTGDFKHPPSALAFKVKDLY